MDMTDSLKDQVARWFTVALLVVIGVGGAVSVWPTYLRGRSLKRQDEELSAVPPDSTGIRICSVGGESRVS